MLYVSEYTIHTTPQLIDVNRSLKQFKANVSIKSRNVEDEFEVLFITQSDLSNIEDKKFKTVVNTISADLESKPNNVDNYILVLQSQSPVVVTVSIDIDDTSVPDNEEIEEIIGNDDKSSSVVSFFRKNGFYIIIIIIIGILIYYLFFKNKGEKKESFEDKSSDIPFSDKDLIPIDAATRRELPELLPPIPDVPAPTITQPAPDINLYPTVPTVSQIPEVAPEVAPIPVKVTVDEVVATPPMQNVSDGVGVGESVKESVRESVSDKGGGGDLLEKLRRMRMKN